MTIGLMGGQLIPVNITSIVGFIIAFSVIYQGVIHPAPKPDLFLDPHALILVVGGTLATALIAYPARRLLNLANLLIFGMIFKRKTDHRVLVNEMVVTARLVRETPIGVAQRGALHPFLTEGYLLIAESKLNEKDLHEVLVRRSKFFKKSYMDDAKILTAIAKFPPAFGLLGASTGMITMMTNLGSGGQDTIGPAMAVALVATFWGIAMANLIFLPLADYAVKAAEEDQFTRGLIIAGLMLIKQKTPEAIVAEKLNSYLPIKRRVDLKRTISLALSREREKEHERERERERKTKQKPAA
ncbi:MotA/TolQ/ExbB proton channel family protein [Bdellovibrionota bacterium FG-1]